MKIGIVKEIKNNEYRVAVVLSGVAEFVRRGHEVFVEHDAGSGSLYDDIAYKEAGAKAGLTAEEVWRSSDLIYKVKEIFPEEYKYLREDMIVFTYIHSNAHRDQTEALIKSKCKSIAYEDISDDRGEWPLLSPISERHLLLKLQHFGLIMRFCHSSVPFFVCLLLFACCLSAPPPSAEAKQAIATQSKTRVAAAAPKAAKAAEMRSKCFSPTM